MTEQNDTSVPMSMESDQNAAFEAAKAEVRAKRRSFIFKILIFWFGLMFTIILLMVFVRSTALNEPDQIAAKIAEMIDFQPPERFEPYRGNVFMGAHSLSYWANDDRREDGRSTSVVAFYWEKDWRAQTAAEVAALMADKLPNRLNRNEFHADRMIEESIDVQGESKTVYRFDGTHRIDDKLMPGTSCFRYVDTPQGPIQIQTIGLHESFPPEEQLAVLALIQELPEIRRE